MSITRREHSTSESNTKTAASPFLLPSSFWKEIPLVWPLPRSLVTSYEEDVYEAWDMGRKAIPPLSSLARTSGKETEGLSGGGATGLGVTRH